MNKKRHFVLFCGFKKTFLRVIFSRVLWTIKLWPRKKKLRGRWRREGFKIVQRVTDVRVVLTRENVLAGHLQIKMIIIISWTSYTWKHEAWMERWWGEHRDKTSLYSLWVNHSSCLTTSQQFSKPTIIVTITIFIKIGLGQIEKLEISQKRYLNRTIETWNWKVMKNT